MIDFFNETGKMAIGSRLRMLTEKVTENAAQIYGRRSVFAVGWYQKEGAKVKVFKVLFGPRPVGH